MQNADVVECIFAGPADGESALKESGDVHLKECSFSLRYPLWHVKKFTMENSTMDELTRAAIWYATDGVIQNSTLGGIKAVRECERIRLEACHIVSQEFGWKSKEITLTDSDIESEYLFFDSRDVKLERVKMKGKYSFQYMKNLEISDCVLDTKDAFWHTENVPVITSEINGEYRGWHSRNLHLINCRISGTQPLCYCKNLVMDNCTMAEDCDLAFEESTLNADVNSVITSVKNPTSGVIAAKGYGEIILDENIKQPADCRISTKE